MASLKKKPRRPTNGARMEAFLGVPMYGDMRREITNRAVAEDRSAAAWARVQLARVLSGELVEK